MKFLACLLLLCALATVSIASKKHGKEVKSEKKKEKEESSSESIDEENARLNDIMMSYTAKEIDAVHLFLRGVYLEKATELMSVMNGMDLHGADGVNESGFKVAMIAAIRNFHCDAFAGECPLQTFSVELPTSAGTKKVQIALDKIQSEPLFNCSNGKEGYPDIVVTLRLHQLDELVINLPFRIIFELKYARAGFFQSFKGDYKEPENLTKFALKYMNMGESEALSSVYRDYKLSRTIKQKVEGEDLRLQISKYVHSSTVAIEGFTFGNAVLGAIKRIFYPSYYFKRYHNDMVHKVNVITH